MQWQADSVQAVIFTATASLQRDALSLWALLFNGEGPDGFHRATASPTLLSTASGERNGLGVTLNAQVGRIDITLNPVAPAVPGFAQVGGPPRITDVEYAVGNAAAYLSALAAVTPAARLAVVLDLAVTVVAGKEAEVFGAALPGVFVPALSTDNVYQFNQRKISAVAENVELNRVCTWTTGEVGFIVGPQMGVHVANPVQMSRFVGLKVDVNTVPTSRPSASAIPAIVAELQYEASSISQLQLEHFR